MSKILKFLLISFFIFDELNSQENNFLAEIKSSPHESDFWWNDYNNYGLDLSKINFSSKINIIRGNVTYFSQIFILDDEVNLLFKETYLKISIKNNTFLKIGKYYRDFSNYFNDDLSSGHFLISRNSSPMPKIGIVSNKTFKKFKKLDFDYGIAHGQFKKDDFYLEAPFLHEKFLYMNIDLKQNKKLSIGIVHEAIWAGETQELGKLPSSFKDYLKVFISADGPLLEGEPHPNALGSHVGIWDFNFNKKYEGDRSLKLYYQHYFEDTSSLRFANKTDGLWGAELINFLPKTNFLIEYINTKNAWSDPPYQRDYYYWNYQYKLGWSYENNALGNPLVKAFKLGEFVHLGSKGEISEYHYDLRILRKINAHDNFKYTFSINKNINNRLKVGVFTMNSSSKSNFYGISFSTFFK